MTVPDPSINMPVAEIIDIVRNVTGRVDPNDPQFTDAKMLNYIERFYTLQMPTDIRVNEQRQWLEFDITSLTADPLPINLQNVLGTGEQYSTLEPPVYVDGFRSEWYQDPGDFFARWPETQTYEPTRPFAILYYNNELIFRPPPKPGNTYHIKIAAYRNVIGLTDTSALIPNNYLWRYIAYGASMNIFADFNEMDQYQQTKMVWKTYRETVYARTYQQNMNQRSIPSF